MKRFFTILLALSLVFAVSPTVFAKDSSQDLKLTNVSFVQPRWVYQFEHTSYRIVGINEDLGDTMYVTIPSGYYEPDGTAIMARGTLYLVGTAYDFPQVGKKEGTYQGTVTAYINN